jgi:hypothetical protein
MNPENENISLGIYFEDPEWKNMQLLGCVLDTEDRKWKLNSKV